MLKNKIRVSCALPMAFRKVGDFAIDIRQRNEDKSVKCLPIDQFSGQPFMLNDCGFIMNDIEAFENTQSDSIARAVLSRVPVFKTSDADDGLSVTERLQEVLPANCCSPAEFARASKYIARVRYQRAADKAAARAAAVAAARTKDSPKKVDISQTKTE